MITTKRVLYVMLFCLMCAALGFGQQATVSSSAKEGPQFSAGYTYEKSQTALGSSWFGMNGGRADVMVPFTRHFGLVAEFSGTHTNSVPSAGTGLTLLTYMAGPRLSMPLRRGHEAGSIVPFTQVLFGGVRATEGAFPGGTVMESRANSFAMSAGGGLQVGLTRRVSLRLIQAEYLYTRLPNLLDNYQNSYRIGAGLTFQLR
jgi:outer membrane immunogenic protein